MIFMVAENCSIISTNQDQCPSLHIFSKPTTPNSSNLSLTLKGFPFGTFLVLNHIVLTLISGLYCHFKIDCAHLFLLSAKARAFCCLNLRVIIDLVDSKSGTTTSSSIPLGQGPIISEAFCATGFMA